MCSSGSGSLGRANANTLQLARIESKSELALKLMQINFILQGFLFFIKLPKKIKKFLIESTTVILLYVLFIQERPSFCTNTKVNLIRLDIYTHP